MNGFFILLNEEISRGIFVRSYPVVKYLVWRNLYCVTTHLLGSAIPRFFLHSVSNYIASICFLYQFYFLPLPPINKMHKSWKLKKCQKIIVRLFW